MDTGTLAQIITGALMIVGLFFSLTKITKALGEGVDVLVAFIGMLDDGRVSKEELDILKKEFDEFKASLKKPATTKKATKK